MISKVDNTVIVKLVDSCVRMYYCNDECFFL